MYKWKRGTALVTAVVAAFGAGFMLAPAASAATPSATIELSQDDLDYYYSVAERFGVPEAVQESLLEKVKAGIPLDSSTGVAPVSTVTTEVDGFERTVETFPDGSVIGTDIEIPQVIEDGVSARGVAGCVTGASAGVYYGQDCWVYSSSLTGTHLKSTSSVAQSAIRSGVTPPEPTAASPSSGTLTSAASSPWGLGCV